MTSAQAGGPAVEDSDGVLVVSVWKHGPDGFLGRLTATQPGGASSETLVTSPDELLETVRTWLSTAV